MQRKCGREHTSGYLALVDGEWVSVSVASLVICVSVYIMLSWIDLYNINKKGGNKLLKANVNVLYFLNHWQCHH